VLVVSNGLRAVRATAACLQSWFHGLPGWSMRESRDGRPKLRRLRECVCRWFGLPKRGVWMGMPRGIGAMLRWVQYALPESVSLKRPPAPRPPLAPRHLPRPLRGKSIDHEEAERRLRSAIAEGDVSDDAGPGVFDRIRAKYGLPDR
jgi:hypothetical protein